MRAEPVLRPAGEIQRAHDLLLQLTMDGLLAKENQPKVIAALDVLCWVLHHDHNTTFGKNLDSIERLMQEAGFEFVENPGGLIYPEDVM
jgi:hypothetical protein